MFNSYNVSKYLTDHWVQLQKLDIKAKILIAAVLVFSFVIGVTTPMGWQFITGSANLKQKTVTTAAPTPIPIPASIQLTSDKTGVEAGATFSAMINIDSGDRYIEAADFVVNFDPMFVKVATISSGNYFGLYPIQTLGENFIRLSGMANLVNDKFVVPKGKGQVGKIVFETLVATDSTKISFDREKTIAASGGKNIVGKISDLDIVIK